MPEVTSVIPFLSPTSAQTSAPGGLGVGSFVYQFKVGIFFGKSRPGGSPLETDGPRPQPMLEPVQPIEQVLKHV